MLLDKEGSIFELFYRNLKNGLFMIIVILGEFVLNVLVFFMFGVVNIKCCILIMIFVMK